MVLCDGIRHGSILVINMLMMMKKNAPERAKICAVGPASARRWQGNSQAGDIAQRYRDIFA